MSNSISSNRSTLKEFLASIATIQGDLSNITAPPFVLGECSTVELPQYWVDHPSLFVAPANGSTPEERAVLVLKWFLGSLKNQQYAGRDESEGVKKPLNAFLGELFLGSFQDEENGETRLVSEQVSHHPPVTACYLWNEKHGVRAEGFTCQEITFSGSVSIKQKGYAIIHLDKHDEDYLIPVPNVKVKGVITGTPYPELTGTYTICSSTGIMSEVKFEGKGWLGGGTKNSIEARVYHADRPSDDLYTAEGSWNKGFTIRDSKSGQNVVTYEVDGARAPIQVPQRSEQDPWESRRAWGGVIDGLLAGDMKAVSEQKSIVEQAQRQMRKDEQAQGKEFDRVFFHRQDDDALFEKLSADHKSSFEIDSEGGIWKVDHEVVQSAQKPFHGELVPDGKSSRSVREENEPEASSKVFQKSEPDTDMASPNDTRETSLPAPKSDDEQERLEKLQVEEMLRARYSSSGR